MRKAMLKVVWLCLAALAVALQLGLGPRAL